MTKAELRKYYRKERSRLTEEELYMLNTGILRQLSQLDWQGTRYIHTFLPISGQKEPDMWTVIADIRANYPAIKVVVSRSEPKDHSMAHFLLADDTVLKENAWGITEPVGGESVMEMSLDVVFVPLLIVDKEGNRVGYGKGFYDRFLAKCRPDCKKIGVSFFEPIAEIDDVDPLDVPLDMVVTPYSTIVFA